MADVFLDSIRAIFNGMASVDTDFVSVTYSPVTGDPVEVQLAHYRQESFASPDTFNFRSTQFEKTVECVLEDLGRVPDIGETLTIDGIEYEITDAPVVDGRTVRMVIR